MKRPILFAIIFTQAAFPALAKCRNQANQARSTPAGREVIVREGYMRADAVNTLTAAEARELAPVAARISRQRLAHPRPTISGILPRLANTPAPARMISPTAPRDLGAGWNLVTFTDRDPYRSVTPNILAPQPTGLSLFGVRGIW